MLSFPALLQWPIVAYNPRARALKARAAAVGSHDDTVAVAGGQAGDGWEGRGSSDADRDKRYHLRTIAELVGCNVADCMLIDDMPGSHSKSWLCSVLSLTRYVLGPAENVDTANADGAHGVLVQQPEAGFRLEDIEAWLRRRPL